MPDVWVAPRLSDLLQETLLMHCTMCFALLLYSWWRYGKAAAATIAALAAAAAAAASVTAAAAATPAA
jgi:hypothetical protein